MQLRTLLVCMLLFEGFSPAQCPRIFPASVHLYLPATPPPGPYPFVYESAAVWVSCDTAPATGLLVEAKVTGTVPVSIMPEWSMAYRPLDTIDPNLHLFVLSHAIGPALGTQEGAIEISVGGQIAKLPVSVTITDAPFIKPYDTTIELDRTPQTAIWFPNARTALPFMLSLPPSGWLATGVSSGSGYTRLFTSISSSSLPGGEYLGEMTVSAPGAVNSPLQIPVRLLHNNGFLRATPSSPAASVFITQSAPRTATFDLLIESTAENAFPFTIESDSAWLSVSPSSGATPAHVTVTADATSAPLGTYHLKLYVYSAASSTLTVPVTLTVSGANTLTLSPIEMNVFTWPGRVLIAAPDNPVLHITSTRPMTAAVESPKWLPPRFPASTITTPKDIEFDMRWELLNPNPSAPLPAAKFSGTIIVSSAEASNGPQTAAVNAYSLAGAPLKLSPDYINFSGQIPRSQSVSVTAPTPTTFTVSPPPSGTWLSVSPLVATTPATFVITQTVARPSTIPSPEVVTLFVTLENMPPVPVYLSVFD